MATSQTPCPAAARQGRRQDPRLLPDTLTLGQPRELTASAASLPEGRTAFGNGASCWKLGTRRLCRPARLAAQSLGSLTPRQAEGSSWRQD